jgi:hypothetical protein
MNAPQEPDLLFSQDKYSPWWQHPLGVGRMMRSGAVTMLLCGAYGASWGILAGGLAGSCVFPPIGTMFGGLCGIPFGAAAGMLGSIFGGRWGGAGGGAISGFSGGIALSIIINLLRVTGTNVFSGPIAPNFINDLLATLKIGYETDQPLLLLLALFAPSIFGGLMGYWLGYKLEATTPSRPGSILARLQTHIAHSPLYLMPTWARLGVGALIVLSVVAVMKQFYSMSL